MVLNFERGRVTPGVNYRIIPPHETVSAPATKEQIHNGESGQGILMNMTCEVVEGEGFVTLSTISDTEDKIKIMEAYDNSRNRYISTSSVLLQQNAQTSFHIEIRAREGGTFHVTNLSLNILRIEPL